MGNIVKESVKHIFTEQEKLELSGIMAAASIEADRLQAELKNKTARYKGNISAENAKIKSHATLIKDGYEYRTIDVRCEFENGKACFYDLETGAKVKERGMTEKEHQMELDV